MKCHKVRSDESECDDNSAGEFMYIPVNIKGMQVAALLDTGSSINSPPAEKSLVSVVVQRTNFEFNDDRHSLIHITESNFW